jgi:nucleoside-diphosphate-sugar epimerase
MPIALITGAAGVMGARLVERVRDAGWQVRALVLPGDPLRSRALALGCDVREGDVSQAASLAGLCEGVDTVYHLAAVIVSHDDRMFRRINRDGTENLVHEAMRASVRHFIYVSSASVTYPRRTPYAESKLEAEAMVRSATGLAYTIVRPTLVYERGGGQELMMFLDYLRRFPVVPFIGTGRALKRPVWSGDVVDGLARLLGNPTALGKTYNLSGAEAISMLELAQLLLAHHGLKRPFVHVPVPLCRALAWLAALLMKRPPLTLSAIAGVVNDADLDPSLAMGELGYRPLGVREGFQRCFPNASKANGVAQRGDAFSLSSQKGNVS